MHLLDPTKHRDSPAAADAEARWDPLRSAIDRAARLLPAQGPITVFIHHNTLHAFEDLPFDEGVKKAARVFGCQAYLSEDQYRDHLKRGRIRFSELRSVVEKHLGARGDDEILRLGTRLELRLAMLQYPLRHGPTEELVWFMAEKDALHRVRSEASSALRERLIAETRRWVMRDVRPSGKVGAAMTDGAARDAHARLARVFARFDESAIESWSEDTWEAFTLQALWRLCCDGAADVPSFTVAPPPPIRHRDLLLEATGDDADKLVHEVLMRCCAAFLDQGFATWQTPGRAEGFYRSFCALYAGPGLVPRWMKGLPAELSRLQQARIGPLESIDESLRALGVSANEWDEYLTATLLALRGWAGMIRQVEIRQDLAVYPVPAGSLIDFVAIRLLLDQWALAWTARQAMDFAQPLDELRGAARSRIEPPTGPSTEQRAFMIFQLAQILGWTPEELHRLQCADWAILLEEIESFTRLDRRHMFHLAYEQRFCTQTLDAVALHACDPAPTPRRPRFQALFCIDDREESMRRHLEEVRPDAETLSVAGFFFTPMYYRGAADAHFVPLCPVAMQPSCWVVEQVVESHAQDHQRRARTRRALGMATHHIHRGTRSAVLGALLSAAIGVLASIPLVARTIFPRLTARIRSKVGRFVATSRLTRLRLERLDPLPGPANGQLGFSLDEMTASAERVLCDTGLTAGFSRLVLIIGHGSTSVNNPHESAYHCGACGGASGGPNARAIALMLNDARIRARLAERGIVVPAETVFVGALHDTSCDSVTFYDLEQVPQSHRDELDFVRKALGEACARNAHERCRRFGSAPLTQSFVAAQLHVEGRSEDLAQPRPELGHATNAISIVGRRAWTRGLFLDRRALLTSYDPGQDDADHTVLTRILLAIFPVCAGINLEYLFSTIDNVGYGCGSKLPHNITALVGVMDGAASDLRTGLPWQMVEIHEPVRLLNIIETTPDAMLGILERQAGIARLCRNGWVHLAVLHPETRKISVFRAGGFHDYQPTATVLPSAGSSAAWYRGWRDHLDFARIDS